MLRIAEREVADLWQVDNDDIEIVQVGRNEVLVIVLRCGGKQRIFANIDDRRS